MVVSTGTKTVSLSTEAEATFCSSHCNTKIPNDGRSQPQVIPEPIFHWRTNHVKCELLASGWDCPDGIGREWRLAGIGDSRGRPCHYGRELRSAGSGKAGDQIKRGWVDGTESGRITVLFDNQRRSSRLVRRDQSHLWSSIAGTIVSAINRATPHMVPLTGLV